MLEKKYWIGLRQSEIECVEDFFEDSIVIFGNKDKKAIQTLKDKLQKNINHNNQKNYEIITNYQKECIKNILSKNLDAKFMFYNQILARKYFEHDSHFICLNKKELLEKLDSKLYVREFYKNKIPSLKHFIIEGKKINIKYLNCIFNNEESRYIVQSDNGSGGSGTLLFENDNQINEIEDKEKYLVTIYQKKSIPINVHLMISKNDILVFPGSIKIIEDQFNHLCYKGSDFISYKDLSDNLKNKTIKYSKVIGKDIQSKGYLGICGIDFLIFENEVYFMEINSRFQNSSVLLNKALRENNFYSLQEMNYMCFSNKEFDYKKVDVNYSSYISDFNEETNTILPINPIEILDNSTCLYETEKLSYNRTLMFNERIFEVK